MKLTTILTAAIPILTVAIPNPELSGDRQSNGRELGLHTEIGDWETASGPAGQAGDRPATGTDVHGNPLNSGGASTQDRDDRHVQPPGRGLEVRDARDEKDHYIQECTTKSRGKCVQNLVVPKGKSKGGCIARTYKALASGYIHIIDPNVMCRYYEEAGCKGEMSGPYSHIEMDYTIDVYMTKQFIYNPQSYQCQLIGFDGDDVPVKPPTAFKPVDGN